MTGPKTCRVCGESKPSDRVHFGSTPQGNLRGRCRKCDEDDNKRWRVANKERYRQRMQQRKRADAGIVFSAADRSQFLLRQNGFCLCCRLRIEPDQDVQVDHVLPLSRGGSNASDNLMLAHTQCNREKANKTLEEHWAWRLKVGLD